MQFDTIVLDGRYREVPSSFGGILSIAKRENDFTYSDFLSHVYALCNSRRVVDVLVVYRSGFRVPGFAVLEEIGEQLTRLVQSGKRVHFFADEYTESTAFLASFATIRYMHPLGTVRLLGFSQSMLYFRPLLNRLGVEPIIARRGAYKSSADSVEYDRRQSEDAEQIRRYLDVTDARVSTRLSSLAKASSDRDSSAAETSTGIYLFAQEARDRDWVDELATEEEIRQRLKSRKSKEAKLRRKSDRYGKGKRIAILAIEGTIVDGENRGPGADQQAGARNIAEAAAQLKEDKKIAGVVVRINSPGGSATASEAIRSALLSLAETKPLLVSFGALAASGGYWVAALGRIIYASDTTITGSIGALLLYPNVQSLLQKWGIRSDTVRTGPHADFPSSLRPVDAAERDYLERQLDDLYRQFLERVGEARSLELDTVDALAQGRVWSGVDARDNALVDEQGGLSAAIGALQRQLGLKRVSVHFFPRAKRSLLQRFLSQRGLSAEAGAPATLDTALVHAILQQFVPLTSLPLKRPLLYAPSLPHETTNYFMT